MSYIRLLRYNVGREIVGIMVFFRDVDKDVDLIFVICVIVCIL